jgi:hypothetical protein
MKDGGPAFPRTCTEDRDGYGDAGWEGMSLRDYFAAKAMLAVANEQMNAGKDEDRLAAQITAELAYLIADAMLKARK